MTAISDEQMREALGTSRPYTIVILKAGPRRHAPGADKLIWEHGRRNMELRAEGLLSIVCPVVDNSAVDGVGIFDLDQDRTREVIEGDPAVRAGLFTYEIHPCRSFPGDALPG